MYMACCLNLIQAWVAAGRPNGKRTLGGFEESSDVFGGILDVIGVSGFLQNSEKYRKEADAEAPLRAFIKKWFEKHGTSTVTVKNQLLELVGDLDLGTEPANSGRVLGKLLQKHVNRRFGNVILRAESHKNKVRQWKLESVRRVRLKKSSRQPR